MLNHAALIVALEDRADRLDPAINRLRRQGDKRAADALLHLARSQRIRALEARGQLLALAGGSTDGCAY